jgi:hypothetical protein
VGALVHLGYPFRCRNGRFIIEGPVNVRVQQKASVTSSRLSAALRVAVTIDLQGAAEAIGMGDRPFLGEG